MRHLVGQGLDDRYPGDVEECEPVEIQPFTERHPRRGFELQAAFESNIAELFCLEVAAHAVGSADCELLVTDDRLDGILTGNRCNDRELLEEHYADAGAAA